MRNLMWVGVVLIVLGIAGLAIPYVQFTETKEVVDMGPIEINKEEKHTIPIPMIASIIAIIAGLGLAVASRRQN